MARPIAPLPPVRRRLAESTATCRKAVRSPDAHRPVAATGREATTIRREVSIGAACPGPGRQVVLDGKFVPSCPAVGAESGGGRATGCPTGATGWATGATGWPAPDCAHGCWTEGDWVAAGVRSDS